MPSYNTKFCKELFQKVLHKVDDILSQQGESGLYTRPKGEQPSLITFIIQEELNLTSSTLNPSTLNQKFFFELKKETGEFISLSDQYLIPFCMFAENITEAAAKKLIESNAQSYDTKKETPAGNNKLNPVFPEFPEDDPSFPASPHYRIPIPGFKRVWLKDESYNPCGTHKDRKALEIVKFLYDEIVTKRTSQPNKTHSISPVSIISSGNEAYSLQYLLKRKNYPALRVILDNRYKETDIDKKLAEIGCNIWYHDTHEELSSADVKRITENPNGWDFTSYIKSDLKKSREKFYDWLTYEVLNLSPDYCFLPVGTGDLMLNLLKLNKAEIENVQNKLPKDERFFGDVPRLKNCNFLGATTNDLGSKADKLYTTFNKATDEPFTEEIQQYILGNFCGPETSVHELHEGYLDLAISYANALSINHEPSGIAGLALFFEKMHTINPDKKIVIINTGKLKVNEDMEGVEKKVKSIIEKVKKLNKEKK